MSKMPAITYMRVPAMLHHLRRHALEALFAPRSIAIIGVSETLGSVGRTLVENLKGGNRFLFAVSP
jgi:hypothetical protein